MDSLILEFESELSLGVDDFEYECNKSMLCSLLRIEDYVTRLVCF